MHRQAATKRYSLWLFSILISLQDTFLILANKDKLHEAWLMDRKAPGIE